MDLGTKLGIRSMIYVAGEPVPFFWPMRSFIHHNPLHGLESLPFADALEKGKQLFHARAYLQRRQHQAYLDEGRVSRAILADEVSKLVGELPEVEGIDWPAWLMTLLTEVPIPITRSGGLCDAGDLHAALNGSTGPSHDDSEVTRKVTEQLETRLLGSKPLYETIDSLYGTTIGADLDELVIKICLDFFDEGQSVWEMPDRHVGLFSAWRDLASRNIWPSRRNRLVRKVLAVSDEPEDIIAHVMEQLKVPEEKWQDYFSHEVARLHGWSGFIRWRASAKHYYWTKQYPADLVDLVAIRLTLGLALMSEHHPRGATTEAECLAETIRSRPEEFYLRHELHGGGALPAFAQRLDETLSRHNADKTRALFRDYTAAKRRHQAEAQAEHLRDLAERVGAASQLTRLDRGQVDGLLQGLRKVEQDEGMLWLRSMETLAIGTLLDGIQPEPAADRDKRPFVQAAFCIDTRSERIRRQLEAVGDYQTYGVAGFFGVPVSFMELGKGSEQHLCPVLLTPKNLVLEMTTEAKTSQAALTSLEKAMHDLKESVLTPFVTVEAIGLLFGFDMIGKTVAPRGYHRWRNRLHEHKPTTHLMLDKLTLEQADSMVRAAQRAVIVKAVELDLDLQPEDINDSMVRELREAALNEHTDPALSTETCSALGVDDCGAEFIKRLRDEYRINRRFARLQIEQLGRIGFTVDEQAAFVFQALSSIGLTKDFSRFVLLIGHGSHSLNNPYESALDCGACGGAHGLISARVLAQMANKPVVRERLRAQGVDIPDDAWFVPGHHNTTTDEISLYGLERLPAPHLVYLDRLRGGLIAAARRCAQERIPSLNGEAAAADPHSAALTAQQNAMDWSQVRPEWGLSGNAYFIVGRREMTRELMLDGRAFLHSYDYRLDPKLRLLENILTGPLVVGQWINMEHYFSTVDNQRFGSGSKVYHNVAGRFGVMSGNLSDLRTGLPAQTVLDRGEPYHQPMRLITLIEAPLDKAQRAIAAVRSVKQLVRNDWIRVLVLDPETRRTHLYHDGQWLEQPLGSKLKSDTQALETAA